MNQENILNINGKKRKYTNDHNEKYELSTHTNGLINLFISNYQQELMIKFMNSKYFIG